MKRFLEWIFRMIDIKDFNHPEHPRNKTNVKKRI